MKGEMKSINADLPYITMPSYLEMTAFNKHK